MTEEKKRKYRINTTAGARNIKPAKVAFAPRMKLSSHTDRPAGFRNFIKSNGMIAPSSFTATARNVYKRNAPFSLSLSPFRTEVSFFLLRDSSKTRPKAAGFVTSAPYQFLSMPLPPPRNHAPGRGDGGVGTMVARRVFDV